ncbi:MAG: hypothetical protein K940chlam2_01441 [Chlamydiae bacterium]|nr:hypothetical protein [Chlamydiota bacterium]
MTEDLGLRVADLYASGSSFGAIGKELEISKSSVGGHLRSGIEALRNNSVHEVVEQANNPENDGSIIPDLVRGPNVGEAWERTMLIQATPILRKVVLNSKVYIQHEFFQKHLGYTGDIGDLLVEALDYYWKEMGFQIKITHDSVI